MAHGKGDSGSFFALTRHDEYFLAGGDLYLMVDHVQFRVHRYFFERESPFFRSKLAGPASPGSQKMGNSESTAIILDGLKPAEFARFLWVFYNPKYSIYNASVEDWTVILRLAHKWSFHEVKDLAVRELERLDSPDIDRIVAYHDCEVDRNLLIPRYAALCHRERPLELEEGMRLGLETTLMIARAREFARGSLTPSGARSPTAATLARDEMVTLIRELFGIPAPITDVPIVTSVVASTSTTTTNGTNGAHSSTAPDAGEDQKAHGRKGNAATNGRPTVPVINTNATSSAPEQPPKPPLKADAFSTGTEHGPLSASFSSSMSSLATKFERVVSNTLGPGADTSKDKDGGKDTNKDSGKDTNKDATNKDTNKDKDKDNNTTKAGALTTESGANRGRRA
ncbi:hypothetical protein AX14_001169 [Amanita brunnescens Koide BX004]|nr:hypothetical protein AX14_001169 [Amanita brunnescens Koide BX004]